MEEERQADDLLDEFYEYWSSHGGNLTKEEAQACATFAQYIAAQGYVLIRKGG